MSHVYSELPLARHIQEDQCVMLILNNAEKVWCANIDAYQLPPGYAVLMKADAKLGSTDKSRSTLPWLPRHRWWVAGALLILAVSVWAAYRFLIGPTVVVYPVVRGDLVRTVVASGHVETPFRVNISSQIVATVKDVLVEEGQAVKQGQALISLDSSELNAAVEQAQSAVDQADASIRRLRDLTLPAAEQTLRQAEAGRAQAQASFNRAEQLVSSGAISQSAYDSAMRDLSVAQAQERAAQLQVASSKPGGSDYEVAQTQLAQAQANLVSAKVRLGYATIYAPRDGVLITRGVERGAVVQPGTSLLLLAPAGQLQLVLQIDEKNLGLLQLGQTALASADAYADQTFNAKLTYINPSVDITRASLEVKLTVDDPPSYLRQDMTVSVDIAVDRRSGTLVAPARAVHDANSASPWVLVVRDGRAWQQPVKLGLRAVDQVEILSGVSAGDLLVPVASGARSGQRLRAVHE